MRGGFGPRFVVEAIFLVAVAAVAGLAEFPTEAIVLVMGLAWLLVAGVEWALSRAGSFPGQALFRRAAPAENVPPIEEVPAPQHVRVIPREPEPAAQPVIERRPEPMPEPELEAPPAPEPAPPVVEPVLATPTPTVEQPAIEPPLPEPEPEPEPEPAIAPTGGLAASGTVPGTDVRGPEPPPAEREPLVAVPAPPPIEEQPPVEAPPAEEERVVALPISTAPREWNVWELERLVRQHSGADASVDEERSYLLVYLREFATPEGTLPVDFDGLVRESFGTLLAARR